MNLQKVSDLKLDENLKSLVQSEREILSDILLHIAEVDRRKLYLTFGYRSLFDYLTQSIGYANGSAQRRIDAARLSYDVPEILEKIESGTINLSQASLVQKAIREKQSILKVKVDSKVKSDLVNQLTEKSFIESEVLVAKALDVEIKSYPAIKHQKDESVRLEITLSKSQWVKLKKMRELLSHSLPSGQGVRIKTPFSEAAARGNLDPKPLASVYF